MVCNDMLQVVPPPTPVSNTGFDSNFQTLSPISQLQVHVDWLQGTCKPLNDVFVEELIGSVCRALGDQPVYEWNQGSYVGKQWQHRGHSVKGLRFWWDSPGETQNSHLLLSLPGSICSSVEVEVIWNLSRFLNDVFAFKVTRIDLALDDYSKRLEFENLLTASREGLFARVRQLVPHFACLRNRRMKGWTFDVGSKQSDSYGVIYDKETESDGRIKSVRFEGRFKDEVAHALWLQWLSIPDESFQELSPQFLAGKTIGIVEFCERLPKEKNVSRMKRLPWWESFVAAVGSHLRHSVKKEDSTLDRAKRWVERQVTGTLAILRKVLGIHEYRRLHDEWLAAAEANFTMEQQAKIVMWSDEQSNVMQKSSGAADVIDEEGQKWAWAWYPSKLQSEWRVARFYGAIDGEARVRFSGESTKAVTVGWIHLGATKPTWTPRLFG